MMIRKPSRPRSWWKGVWLVGCVLVLSGNWYFLLPLWVTLVVIGFTAGGFFYFTRRFPPGHCRKCGYDLTGNVSGVCPECGETAKQDDLG